MLYKVMLSFFLAIVFSGNVLCSSGDKFKTIRMDLVSYDRLSICLLGSVENEKDLSAWIEQQKALYKLEYKVDEGKIKVERKLSVSFLDSGKTQLFFVVLGCEPYGLWNMRAVTDASQENLEAIAKSLRSEYRDCPYTINY